MRKKLNQIWKNVCPQSCFRVKCRFKRAIVGFKKSHFGGLKVEKYQYYAHKIKLRILQKYPKYDDTYFFKYLYRRKQYNNSKKFKLTLFLTRITHILLLKYHICTEYHSFVFYVIAHWILSLYWGAEFWRNVTYCDHHPKAQLIGALIQIPTRLIAILVIQNWPTPSVNL